MKIFKAWRLRLYLYKTLFILLTILSLTSLEAQTQVSDGLAPEVTDLNAKDISFDKEKDLPYLERPYVSAAPRDHKDGLMVGVLGKKPEGDGGDRAAILAFAKTLIDPPKSKLIASGRDGLTDSLLISYKGKLVFESYYRRGRANYPHYQMSITKAYTSTALGRAIQLGYLKMADLKKPAISFLNDLDKARLVNGAETITLEQVLTMQSGIRIEKAKAAALLAHPKKLKGQRQIQSYLSISNVILHENQKFKYQAADPSVVMQVLESVVPGNARTFIEKELLGKLGIDNFYWQEDLSGLPKAAAGSSLRSRDMIKFGQMMLSHGKWQGEQIVPVEFVERALSPIADAGKYKYGYFWWIDTAKSQEKDYRVYAGRGAGGQYLFMLPDLDLVVVITSHNRGMGRLREEAPLVMIKAFAR